MAADYVGKSGVANESSLSHALETLAQTKRVVEAALPYAAPPGRKSKRYWVADPYLRFWLRFVGPNIEEIDRGRSDLVIARIEAAWTSLKACLLACLHEADQPTRSATARR